MKTKFPKNWHQFFAVVRYSWRKIYICTQTLFRQLSECRTGYYGPVMYDSHRHKHYVDLLLLCYYAKHYITSAVWLHFIILVLMQHVKQSLVFSDKISYPVPLGEGMSGSTYALS